VINDHFEFIMENSLVQLNDLPDELILAILKKLDNTNVLYSLVGVNKRLDRIVTDVFYTRNIELLKEQLAASALDRFCLEILPRIYRDVECLALDSSSLERTLLASTYPKLQKLILVKLENALALRHFAGRNLILKPRTQSPTISRSSILDDSPVAHIFKEQILQLVVTQEISSVVTDRILAIFSNLTHLDITFQNRGYYSSVSFCSLSSTASFSSTLVDLRINVYIFDDFLYLLDGRLYQLQSLIVKVDQIVNCSPRIDRTV
jgi:hypothetical protein